MSRSYAAPAACTQPPHTYSQAVGCFCNVLLPNLGTFNIQTHNNLALRRRDLSPLSSPCLLPLCTKYSNEKPHLWHP